MGGTRLSIKKYPTFQLTKPLCRTSGVFHMSFQKCKNAEFSLYVEKKSVCADASCSSAVLDSVCLWQREAGILLMVIMWYDLNRKTVICLIPRCMVGPNLNHNTAKQQDIFGFGLFLS